VTPNHTFNRTPRQRSSIAGRASVAAGSRLTWSLRTSRLQAFCVVRGWDRRQISNRPRMNAINRARATITSRACGPNSLVGHNFGPASESGCPPAGLTCQRCGIALAVSESCRLNALLADRAIYCATAKSSSPAMPR
jgi:hypothetical protein